MERIAQQPFLQKKGPSQPQQLSGKYLAKAYLFRYLWSSNMLCWRACDMLWVIHPMVGIRSPSYHPASLVFHHKASILGYHGYGNPHFFNTSIDWWPSPIRMNHLRSDRGTNIGLAVEHIGNGTFRQLGYPQIIQVMYDHDLVWNPWRPGDPPFWETPRYSIIPYSSKHRASDCIWDWFLMVFGV